MSRIGKKAVPVPSGVTVNISGQHVAVKGPKGELKFALVDHVTAKLEGAAVEPLQADHLLQEPVPLQAGVGGA